MFPPMSQLLTRSFIKCMILPKGKSSLQCLALNHVRDIHITSSVAKKIRIDSTTKIRPVDVKDSNTASGETSTNITALKSKDSNFPNKFTPFQMFDGVQYKDLPIINIKASENNTIMSFTNADGLVMLYHTCGCEGFKNARKSTNVAAQQTTIKFCEKIKEKGYKTARLRIQGLGAGRMGAVKGLELAGMNIVSITDDTRISWHPPRPRKQRRI